MKVPHRSWRLRQFHQHRSKEHLHGLRINLSTFKPSKNHLKLLNDNDNSNLHAINWFSSNLLCKRYLVFWPPIQLEF